MSQFLRPNSDVNANWTPSTGSTRYGVIDETSYDDSDYLIGVMSTTQTVGLSSASTPSERTGHVLRIRTCRSGSLPTCRVLLYSGGTLVKDQTITPGNSYTTTEITLSEAEAGNISSYSSGLTVKMYMNIALGSLYVSWLELEIPDPAVGAVGAGLEMGVLF